MSTFTLKRGHAMAPDRLKAEMQALADQLVEKFGGSCQWQGDEIHYHYSGGLRARVDCQPQEVVVEVELGMMMSLFRGRIESEVRDYLERHIN